MDPGTEDLSRTFIHPFNKLYCYFNLYYCLHSSYTPTHNTDLLVIFTAAPLAISFLLFTALAAVLHFAKQQTSSYAALASNIPLHPSLHTKSQSEQDYGNATFTQMKNKNNNQRITLGQKSNQQYRDLSVAVGVSSVTSGDSGTTTTTDGHELLPSVSLDYHYNPSSPPRLQKSSSAIPFTYR